MPGTDNATATLQYTTNAIEIGEQGDLATAFLQWSVTTEEEYATGDFTTVLFQLVPGSVEVYTTLIAKDHLLEIQQTFPRWHLTEAGTRFYATQEIKYTVSQTERWMVTYMGRGLLNEVQLRG
jgi:hypothetical protein